MKHHEYEVFSELEWEDIIKELALSPRQAQITRHLFSGLSDKQIALTLGISNPTVRTHLTRLFGRLNVEDRNGVIREILRCFRTSCLKKGCPRRRSQS